MPQHPLRPCIEPGCGVLVRGRSSRCELHVRADKRQIEQLRPTAHQRGYTAEWQAYRLRWLWSHPMCAECARAGRGAVPGRNVDHIVPHKGDARLFWDPANHQTLCDPCHNRKTATEDGGFGNVPTPPAT